MKRIKYIALLLCLVCVLTACGTTYQEATDEVSESNDMCNGYFTIVTEWANVSSSYYIVYANDTKVKYLISSSGYKFGITPLYNSDGSLQVYEEVEEDESDDVEE